MDKVILHCDLNNFYASVECVNNPELYGKAVAVCGDPKKRHGIVLAKSNLAKKMGVKTGEAIWQAKQKCPDLIVVPPNYNEYVKYSDIVFELYTRFSDRVESFGIDECWLDVTNSVKLLGSGVDIANEIRQLVKDTTGLTISVGVSFTKIFAKLGSDMKKPDATTVIPQNKFKEIVWPLEISEMIMIGRQMKVRLNKLNIYTLGNLAHASRELLNTHFGIIGEKLIDYANGIETEEVKFYYNNHIPKSIGHGTTTSKDIINIKKASVVVYALSEMVATRLRKYCLLAKGVSVGFRDANLYSISRQMTLPTPTSNANVIAENALKLLEKYCNFAVPLRSIYVYTHKLTDGIDNIQLSFYDKDNEKETRLEESVDKIRKKYGYHSVKRAILLNNDIITNDLHDDDDFLPFKKS